MNVSFYIAKRYLFAKKKTNMINIISAISVIGVMVGTMGLIIGLSGFNGFDSLIKSLFSSFDPEIKITVVEGKSFAARGDAFDKIRNHPAVASYTEIVEDNALIKNGERSIFATIKGVDENYNEMCGIDSMLTMGKFQLMDGSQPLAIFGEGISYDLAVHTRQMEPVSIYVPKRTRGVSLIPTANLNHMLIYPSGIFSIQQEIDNKYVIVPINFARQLFEIEENVHAIELKLKPGYDQKDVQEEFAGLLGNQFNVKDRYQQHDYLYKTMKSEKYATYMILILILVIASFNIVGSLTMLIIDKKEDIAILRSMGADSSLIRNIFLFEGWSISLLGALIGTILGVALCQAQIMFKFIKLQGAESFIIDAYPMKIIASDILIINLSVMIIGLLAAWFPVQFISKRLLNQDSSY